MRQLDPFKAERKSWTSSGLSESKLHFFVQILFCSDGVSPRTGKHPGRRTKRGHVWRPQFPVILTGRQWGSDKDSAFTSGTRDGNNRARHDPPADTDLNHQSSWQGGNLDWGFEREGTSGGGKPFFCSVKLDAFDPCRKLKCFVVSWHILSEKQRDREKAASREKEKTQTRAGRQRHKRQNSRKKENSEFREDDQPRRWRWRLAACLFAFVRWGFVLNRFHIGDAQSFSFVSQQKVAMHAAGMLLFRMIQTNDPTITHVKASKSHFGTGTSCPVLRAVGYLLYWFVRAGGGRSWFNKENHACCAQMFALEQRNCTFSEGIWFYLMLIFWMKIWIFKSLHHILTFLYWPWIK